MLAVFVVLVMLCFVGRIFNRLLDSFLPSAVAAPRRRRAMPRRARRPMLPR